MSVIMFVSALWAQNSISDINRLKRDKDYLYGEATLDTKEAALKLAYELLEMEIKNWALSKDANISSVLASLEEIPQKAETVIETPATKVEPIEPKAQIEPLTASQAPEEKVLQELKDITSFYDLEKKMKPLKAAGEITDYGKYTTMTDPANCYLIIYDQQAVVKAILGKGADKRKNLKTGVDDSEKNYHGCGAIWFKIKE